MKILYIDTPIYPIGGGQLSLLSILKSMKDIDSKLFLPYNCSFENNLKENNISYEIVKISKLYNKIKEYNPDIIHSNSATTRYNFFVAFWANILNIPFIWHNRVNEKAKIKDSIIAFLSTKIIVISDSVKNKFNPFFYKKIIRIYNGIETDIDLKENPLDFKKYLKIDNNEKIIGNFSRLEKSKGHILFLDSFTKVLKKEKKVKALIVGDGSEMDNIKNKAKELKIYENCIFTGYIKNVYDYMNICDIIVNSFVEKEAFSRIIIEAMLLKKIVISTNLGAPIEIIENNKDGFLVEPNSDVLSDKIIEIFNNKEKYKYILDNAFEKVNKNFNINLKINQIKDLYKEIYEKNRN